MILKVIKDVTPLSKGMLVSSTNSYKYSEDADIFNKLVPVPFEEANVIRVNCVLGALPKDCFENCTVEVSNPKHELYKKKFEISSIIMEDIKNRTEFEFMSGIIDPTLIKYIVVEYNGTIIYL